MPTTDGHSVVALSHTTPPRIRASRRCFANMPPYFHDLSLITEHSDVSEDWANECLEGETRSLQLDVGLTRQSYTLHCTIERQTLTYTFNRLLLLRLRLCLRKRLNRPITLLTRTSRLTLETCQSNTGVPAQFWMPICTAPNLATATLHSAHRILSSCSRMIRHPSSTALPHPI